MQVDPVADVATHARPTAPTARRRRSADCTAMPLHAVDGALRLAWRAPRDWMLAGSPALVGRVVLRALAASGCGVGAGCGAASAPARGLTRVLQRSRVASCRGARLVHGCSDASGITAQANERGRQRVRSRDKPARGTRRIQDRHQPAFELRAVRHRQAGAGEQRRKAAGAHDACNLEQLIGVVGAARAGGEHEIVARALALGAQRAAPPSTRAD